MRNLKLYLETTIPNFIFADDAPSEKAITLRLLKDIRTGRFDAYTSEAVVFEIHRTKDEVKRNDLLHSIGGFKILPMDLRAQRLAQEYVRQGIVPVRYEPDAVHIAIATLNSIDVLVTWNMKHLANPRARIAVRDFNRSRRLPSIDISTPLEVIESE